MTIIMSRAARVGQINPAEQKCRVVAPRFFRDRFGISQSAGLASSTVEFICADKLAPRVSPEAWLGKGLAGLMRTTVCVGDVDS